MSNSFGKILKTTTFGESHGNAMGVIIDGMPSDIEISAEYIQNVVNERRPGYNPFTSPRKEADEIEILSGIFEGKTLGSPIAIIVYNKDKKSQDYSAIKDIYRPSHADFTWKEKYTHVDYRGGGRSSARETVSRVIASAFAYKILESFNIRIHAFVTSIADVPLNYDNIDYNEVYRNKFFSADPRIVPTWETLLNKAIEENDSLGATINIVVENCPIGLGEPVFDKLNANLAKAIFSIPAVKGLEFGEGFNISTKKGSEVNDSLIVENNAISFKTNNSGGILGGISNGEDILMKVAIKPTSSIGKVQQSVNHLGKAVSLEIKGRHDPCIGIRAVPICKAMCALVIADALLIRTTNSLG